MKKILTVILAIVAFVAQASAQDIITKKNGEEISARVTEVGAAEVKYKQFGNENGPIYILSKSEIFMIVYQGGMKEMFNIPETAPVQTPQNLPQNQSPATVVGVGSQPQDDMPRTEKVRKLFVEGGLSVFISGDGYFGAAISVGYCLSPNDRLSLDLSMYFKDEKIGSFSYTWGGGMFYDGEISRSYTVSPVLLSWKHEFRLSQKLKLHVGPSIGINYLSAYDEYTTESHDVSKIEGIPDERRANKNLFTGGAVLGLEWRLFKPSGLGFNYVILANKPITFERMEISAITQLIKISYWWKF
jgi:hypothetical protein